MGVMATIALPADAKVLCVQTQRGEPCLWALLNPSAKKIRRSFSIYGTGWNLPETIDEAEYVGTFQLDNETPVFHVFEWKS